MSDLYLKPIGQVDVRNAVNIFTSSSRTLEAEHSELIDAGWVALCQANPLRCVGEPTSCEYIHTSVYMCKNECHISQGHMVY